MSQWVLASLPEKVGRLAPNPAPPAGRSASTSATEAQHSWATHGLS